MSEDAQNGQARFYSSAADPGRARPLDGAEYAAAVSDLRAVVVPIMESTATKLRGHGFPVVTVESSGAMVSLVAVCAFTGIKGTLRFQVHESFAVLVARDPVFWMFTLFSGSEMLLAKPGRLPSVLAQPIEKIVEDFGVACELGLKSRADGTGIYFNDVITWAIDGEPLRPPNGSPELVRLSACAERAWLSWLVVPLMQAARECLERRFPAWSARVLSPLDDGDAQCAMVVDTNLGSSRLRFQQEGGKAEAPAMLYQVTTGGASTPPEALEIVTSQEGRFVAAEALAAIVGEFIYSLAAAWQLTED
jgi:hypothetical protein